MRILITLAIFLLSFSLTASSQRSAKDSLKYYNDRLTCLYDRVWDSLRLNDSAQFLRRQIRRAHERSKHYVAFSFFGGAESANFKSFNAAIARDGFGPLSGPLWLLGTGFSWQTYGGIIVDLNYFVAGFGPSVNNGIASISTGDIEFIQLELGYAVINSRRFTVYPFVGLSGRNSTLNYDNSDSLNSSYNSIASIMHNSRRVHATGTDLDYQAGLGLDWVASYRDKTRSGLIVFAKFGTDGIFGRGTVYEISGTPYDPGIHYGAWCAQLGVKFYTR